MKGILLRYAGACVLALLSIPVQAITLDFFCLTNNDAGDCGFGVSQLSVDVTDAGSSQVLFTFINSGPDASSISEVYFDDGALFGLASVTQSAGDPWTGGSANPGNIPGANNISPAFQASQGFLAESNPSPSMNGVNPGESLAVVFDLIGGMTFADVIADLANGDLRIGMHVIAFASGGSESFVNNPVPVPAAVWLFGSGLIGLVGVARRQRKA